MNFNNLANAITDLYFGSSPGRRRSRNRSNSTSQSSSPLRNTSIHSSLFDVSISVSSNNSLAKATRQSASLSALPPGRMRKTDVIKGGESGIPAAPGAYRHINKQTGHIEYVGQTDNLRVRQQQHAREGKLDTTKQFVQYGVARVDASKDELCQTERDHIARHRPSGNKTKGGNGRR
jgi:hypothetical protein